jgi:hypothetical protein
MKNVCVFCGSATGAHRDLLLVADTVPDLLAALAAWTPPERVTKWAEPEER